MTVGFVGLGAMGYPMAGHLARREPGIRVWNRTSGVAARHASEFGSRAVASLAEVAQASVIFSCLPTSRDVDEVLGMMPALVAGVVWVDCTSGDPSLCRKTAARLAERGVAFLDAPVSGGVAGAEKGSLTVMVGGAEAALAGVRGLMGAFAAKVVHVGPSGAGHALKAVNNTLLAAHIQIAAEGLRALERSGIEVARALEVINTSSGRSHVTENLLPRPLTSGEYPVTFKLALLEKDVRIGTHVIAEAGLIAPLSALIVEVVRNARAELGGDRDYLEMVRLVTPTA